MYPIIEQLASDTDISVDSANFIFSAITCHLLKKIPALDQVVEDVFSDASPEMLKMHLNNMVTELQQLDREKFKTWVMPEDSHTIKQTGSNLIL